MSGRSLVSMYQVAAQQKRLHARLDRMRLPMARYRASRLLPGSIPTLQLKPSRSLVIQDPTNLTSVKVRVSWLLLGIMSQNRWLRRINHVSRVTTNLPKG